jgi:hypothetical protein
MPGSTTYTGVAMAKKPLDDTWLPGHSTRECVSSSMHTIVLSTLPLNRVVHQDCLQRRTLRTTTRVCDLQYINACWVDALSS